MKETGGNDTMDEGAETRFTPASIRWSRRGEVENDPPHTPNRRLERTAKSESAGGSSSTKKPVPIIPDSPLAERPRRTNPPESPRNPARISA